MSQRKSQKRPQPLLYRAQPTPACTAGTQGRRLAMTQHATIRNGTLVFPYYGLEPVFIAEYSDSFENVVVNSDSRAIAATVSAGNPPDRALSFVYESFESDGTRLRFTVCASEANLGTQMVSFTGDGPVPVAIPTGATSVTVQAFGAAGGSGYGGFPGGWGARVQASFALPANTVIYAEPGSQGADGQREAGGSGGQNSFFLGGSGGVPGPDVVDIESNIAGGGGGGGAPSLAWIVPDGQAPEASNISVAAGGGGGSGAFSVKTSTKNIGVGGSGGENGFIGTDGQGSDASHPCCTRGAVIHGGSGGVQDQSGGVGGLGCCVGSDGQSQTAGNGGEGGDSVRCEIETSACTAFAAGGGGGAGFPQAGGGGGGGGVKGAGGGGGSSFVAAQGTAICYDSGLSQGNGYVVFTFFS